MPGNVMDLDIATRQAGHRLDDEAYLRLLAELLNDLLGQTWRAWIDADAGDEPSVNPLDFSGQFNRKARSCNLHGGTFRDREETREIRVRPKPLALRCGGRPCEI
jgi:hypothetical protein